MEGIPEPYQAREWQREDAFLSLLTKNENMIETNDWQKYRLKIKEAKEKWQEVKKLAPNRVGGLEKTINRLSRPFEDGYFTLAIAGKVSAGKSTFINALLGEKDLLPSAFEQTTCTLTEIVHSEDKYLKITYWDDTTNEIKQDITQELAKVVAIPEKYNCLPVNLINQFIVAGLNKKEIVDKRAEIEEKSYKRFNEAILCEYIDSHRPNNIPQKVEIGYPLNENFIGWRIVDTPGVDAIGGIEDTTNEYLTEKNEFGNNNVDAVIFVFNGANTFDDKGLNDFVNKTYKSLTDESKRRLFLVVSHAADGNFQRNKDTQLKLIQQLFVDQEDVKFDKERILTIDSLVELLIRYARNNKKEYTTLRTQKEPSDQWDTKDWDACRDILKLIHGKLEDEDLDENQERYEQQLRYLSGFENLRETLNKFVSKEKKDAFLNVISKIQEDLEGVKGSLKNDLGLLQKKLEGGLNQAEILETERKKIEKILEDLNEGYTNIRRDYSKTDITSRFYKFESRISNLSTCRYIYIAKANAKDIISDIEKEQKEIMAEIKNRLKNSIINSANNTNILFPTIDFDELEQKAHKENDDKVIGHEDEKGLWARIKRFLKWGGIKEIRGVDEKGKLNSFIKSLKSEFTTSLRNYEINLSNYLSDFGADVQRDIKEKTSLQMKINEDLLAKEQSNKEIEENIEFINNSTLTIININEQLKKYIND